MSPRSKEQFEEVRKVSKGKILDAALTLFANNGYEATTISQIAETAAVSKGLMYNYFESKENLLKAMIDQLNDIEVEVMREVYDEEPRVFLRNIFKWYFSELRDNLTHWKLVSRLTMQIEQFDFIRDLAKYKMSDYVSLFEELLTKMGFKKARQEALVIGALFDGITFQYMMEPNGYPIEDLEKFLTEKYCK